MSFSRIAGVGSYLPEKVLTNHDLEKLVDTSDEWIVERSGISERHIAGDDETTVSMAEQAALAALDSSGLEPSQIDLIIIATCTPDKMFPSSACLLQNRLGAVNAASFDISAACSGFVYALSIADQYIKTGAAKQALVVGSETLSRVVNWQDRTTCVLFGDGAGAVVLSASDEPGVLATKLYSDGSYGDILCLPSAVPFPVYDDRAMKISMQGREVFRLAVERLTSSVLNLTELANLNVGDIDWIVPHQANYRIIRMIIAKLKIPAEQVVVTVGEHANTSSASIPLALDRAVKDGRIQRGQTLLLEAFGGGLTWGGAIIKF